MYFSESCHEEPQPKRGKAKKNKSGGKSKQSFKVKVKTEVFCRLICCLDLQILGHRGLLPVREAGKL